jgi:hypothetical protein
VKLPVRYVDHNVLYGPGEAVSALYSLDMVSYPFLPEQDKKVWLQRQARTLVDLGGDFTLLRVNRDYPVEQYHRGAMQMLDPERGDANAWGAYLLGHEERLRQLASFTPEVYLSASLRSERTTGAIAPVVNVTDRIKGLFRTTRHFRLTTRQRHLMNDRERQTFDAIARTLPSTARAHVRDIQWLFRRAATRGVSEPLIDEHWLPPALEINADDGAIEPLETDVIRHARVHLREDLHHHHLEVSGGDAPNETGAPAYQAFLALGALPETMTFPDGAELLFTPLEALSFPVDAVMHCRRIDSRDAVARVKRRVVDADVEYHGQQDSAHGVMSWQLDENRIESRNLLAYLTSPATPPLYEVAISFAVGASSAAQLQDRVRALRASYGSVMLYQPVGLQASLYADHLLRTDVGTVREYADIFTIEQIASLMTIGTHSAGVQGGVLLGETTTGGRRPIRVDLTDAPRRKRTPTVLMSGTLGSGKTITAETMATQALQYGTQLIDLDPKRDHFFHRLPELAGKVRVIEMDGRDDRYEGLLDPIIVAPPEMAEDVAHSYLLDLLPHKESGWSTSILKAVHSVMKHPEPGCKHVVELLLSSQDAVDRAVGEALHVRSQSGIARLGFGPNPRTDSLELDAPGMIIRPGGLHLPDQSVLRASYNSIEALSVATLQLLVSYAMRLIDGPRDIHKLILFDEAWFLLASPDGRRLIERLALTGRTLNVVLMLLTQRLVHVGDVENIAGQRFMFGQQTEHDAQIALKLIGLDPENPMLIERIQGYREGRCLYRDLDGNIAEMQVDVVYPHILETLDTSPRADEGAIA